MLSNVECGACEARAALIEEAQEMMEEEADPEVMDAVIIGQQFQGSVESCQSKVLAFPCYPELP